MHSRTELALAFGALGVRPGETLMLHASMRAVGEVAGGPDVVHLALGDALGNEGTLMMYAGCPAYVDDVGRGGLSAAKEAEILEKLPAFDAETARSARDHGVLVEFFRTSPGTIVNRHPARFAARGPNAARLFATQPWDLAFGHGSALERLVELDGRILLLGSDRDAVTFLHHVEHIADLPGRRIARFRIPVLEDGERVWREMTEVDTSSIGAHPNWPDRFFAKIVDGFLRESHNRGGTVGDTVAFLIPVRPFLDFSRTVMERTAADARAAQNLFEGIGID
jgi:aminoglycoside 3-N-acetyltransferase